ncbi:membrane-spanning 4-domains subfamily A member 4D-like [Rana temporaria]|uniref:membrane-spanning 4-domains subfamily A member 4D-like n=1 Tax=Rana temporaria TaxID=8407 RepID=UPI001AAC603E|nr:membrane-spanning 4-domains subfamily A member 4D-like [Rana temporaria]
MAPHVPDSTFSYEAVPTNISSQEPILSSSNPAPIEVTQPVSSVYNVPQASPVVNMSTVVPQWNVIVPFPQVPHPTTFYQTFLKGKPFALSVVLFFAAAVNVTMGICMIFLFIFKLSMATGNPFWAAFTYVITGIVTLSAHTKASICRVRCSLAMNVISALVSGVSIILASLDLKQLSSRRCRDHCPTMTSDIVVQSVALVNNLLILCVSIILGVFGCLSLSDVPSIQQVFMLYNGPIVPVSASATTSPPLTQYPTPYIIQEDVKSQPTVEITQSP